MRAAYSYGGLVLVRLTRGDARGGEVTTRSVTTYLAEAYLPRTKQGDLGPSWSACARPRARLRPRAPIRSLRSTFVPEDETCFHVFGAGSAAAESAASALAGLGAVRVVEAVREGRGDTAMRRARTTGDSSFGAMT